MAMDIVTPMGIPDRGVDLAPENRPGLPRELAPHLLSGAHQGRPEQQTTQTPVLVRAELAAPTPLFGTTAPPRGLSGAIRRVAYRIPDHQARHWALLLFADRVDAVEHGSAIRWIPAAIGLVAVSAWIARTRRR